MKLVTSFPAMEITNIELKCAKKDASEAEIQRLKAEAKDQIAQYSADAKLRKAIQGCQLHGLILIFRGLILEVCEEVNQ